MSWAEPPKRVVVMWDDTPATSLTLLQHGLQRELKLRGVPAVHRGRLSLQRGVARVLGRARLIRPLFPRRGRRSVTVLSWASEARTFPDSYWREPVPWIFDCWEPQFAAWERLLIRHRVQTAFFSARQAAAYFSERIAGLRTHWLPEACRPELYAGQRPLIERECVVLELGRKWNRLHERIREPLARAGIRHLYSDPGGGKMLFTDLSALISGLGNSAIMLCFPRSTTHPAEAGRIETMTQRYLEGIASGCLIVGRAPRELVDLFGFDPVVPLRMDEPLQHLLEIIGQLPQFQEQVQRAHRRLLEVGTFAQRAEAMLKVLNEEAAGQSARILPLPPKASNSSNR